MPIPTPFHPRTAQRCTSLFWKEWAGYHAVRSYDTVHDLEYLAIRHAAGLIDVSPLFKYDVRGSEAAELLAYVTVRDLRRLRVGRVTYLCWCDDDGKVVDDGTAARLGDDHFRLTANGPSLAWLRQRAEGFDATVEDTTQQLGVLAVQGPGSREILLAAGIAEAERLRFFRIAHSRIGEVPVTVSRTGYTGDLGYEVWVDRESALPVWDALIRAGAPYRLAPAGLDAMDVTRIEAGFILAGVDYFNARHCLVDSRKSSPYEIGLGWTVDLDRDPFVGQAGLRAEQDRGSHWAHAGLVVDWDEYESLFAEFGLPPHVSSTAWRDPVPVFDGHGAQVGQATSGAWSPVLKKNLALATVEERFGRIGTRLRIEVTAEYHRRQITATVVPTPFFDPPRKRGGR